MHFVLFFATVFTPWIRGYCAICSGIAFDSANYTVCLEGGTPTEMQLFRGCEVSAALPSIWAPPLNLIAHNKV